MPGAVALTPKSSAENAKRIRSSELKPTDRSSTDSQALPWFLQAKLTVGAVDDPLEREADRVADRVMRTPGACCAGCASGLACGGEQLQRKPDRGAHVDVDPSEHLKIGGGRKLTEPERAFMEPRFGCEFSGVRLHDNADADTAAQSVQALAFTVGADIFFRKSAYRSGTPPGNLLLAHELSHVVQQGTPSVGSLSSSSLHAGLGDGCSGKS